MSSLSARIGACLALFLSIGLTGCFQPLYGGASGQQLAETLRSIQVAPIPDRMGHYLGDALIFALNGTGSTVTPKYRLVVTPVERVQTPIVDTLTGQATSATLQADAHYVLYPAVGDKILTQGTAFTAAAYNRSLQEFANVTAAQDAEVRDANSLADQIRLRIAGYLATAPVDQ
jgi:LPS-assembly lipoprotein